MSINDHSLYLCSMLLKTSFFLPHLFCNVDFEIILLIEFQLHEINIMNSLNTGLIFTPEVFILCKKVSGLRRLQAMDFDIPFTITAFH